MNNEMFPYINKGCSRVVYGINDDMVIKIARYLNTDSNSSNIARWGIDQCKTELETYLRYGDKFPLCKIFIDLSNEQRIVMERVTPLTDSHLCLELSKINDLIYRLAMEEERDEPDYLESLHPMLQSFAKKILESGLTRQEIHDILDDVEMNNVGIKNNELVILDYGLVG
ncbi:hypothetical protein GAP32_425 [Cronobacter phage vB_CsaM_GAP32]|uniref:Uncharacterized protein n=1 Tax=Cronobacter phage vB_CsaM_GAP32 TaxID=1141136 RepID=K4F768_9CAUD|nr:hypothetical protein GAP32_425 [Cronobacter phage vB_CsaM_GAP32]AFC21878.1 hypothetical protein GAP32_425 [Cronobacter phage vB_CsaM_GAP32]